MRFFFWQDGKKIKERKRKSENRGGECAIKKINVNVCNSRTDAIRFGNKRGVFSWRQSTSVNYFVYAIFSAEFTVARSEMSIVDLFSSVPCAYIRRIVLSTITHRHGHTRARIQT